MANLKIPYLALRDGRPRWVPGRTLRARGFKGKDLKRADGAWMDIGEAMNAAKAINAAITTAPAAPVLVEVRTMAALFDRIKRSPRFSLEGRAPGEDVGANRIGIEKLRLAARTRRDYIAHMRLLEEWCGDIDVTALTPEDVEEFYHDQAEGRGLASANALMRTLKMAMNTAIRKMRWLDFNPVSAVDMANPDGRLVMWEPEEIAAILAAADWCDLPSIGDAFVLGALTGQRKTDILLLPEGELSKGYYVVQQRKRGAKAFVPITKPLLARIEAMRTRKAETWPDVHHTLELISTTSGKSYHREGKEFGRQWRLVRAVASGDVDAIAAVQKERAERKLNDMEPPAPIASCAGKFFSDLRDTAVTLLFMAGCSIAEIANITGHSLKTVQAILDKHYFARNAELAKSAGVKLDAYLETAKIRWA